VRLLTGVNADAQNGADFRYRLFKSGASVKSEDLGEQPVLIEFAGSQGSWRRGKHREFLWILWRFDTAENDWREIARALAYGPEWAPILRDPAIQAMRSVAATSEPNPMVRGREVAAGLLTAIDEAMVMELPAVRMLAIHAIYDGMAGRVAAA
jgi:hypothetical protein